MSGRPNGRSLELYFIDGRPDGMLTAEVFNWTGHVLVSPRTQIKEALARQESKHAGAYILLGEREGEPLAYIGEGDDISLRIKNHDINKDWWTSVAIVTTAANNLHKAHAQYIEARLIETAKSVARVRLENGTSPARPTLNEAARDNMEGFLNYLFLVLPALRIDMFLASTRPAPVIAASTVRPSTEPIFELASAKHGLVASARLVDGEFIVEAGSQARTAWEGSLSHTYRRLHEELVGSSILVPDGVQRRFVANYAFKSPSAAAAVIFGRAANGQTEWKLRGSGLPYKEWEAQQIGGSLGA